MITCEHVLDLVHDIAQKCSLILFELIPLRHTSLRDTMKRTTVIIAKSLIEQ